MKFNLMTVCFLTATTLMSVGCSTPIPTRNPASVQEIKGRSIPENSITETNEASFAIREQGVKISESVTNTLEQPAGKYMLEIDGVLSEDFRSLKGSYSVSFKDGDDAITHKRHVGRPKYGNLKITRDWSGKSAFFEWYKAAQAGKVERKSGSVIILNDNGESERIYLYGAYPTKWKGPELNARSNAEVMEEIEISFESYDLK